jgi:hypothetical protein
MDDASQERALYQRLIEAVDAIRWRVCRVTAPATRWHLAMVERMVADPDRAARTVTLARDHPAKLAEHMASLPQIARAIEEQDRLCAAAWREGRWDEEPADFPPQRDKLMAQFERLCIGASAYERLVREPQKLLVRQAQELTRRRRAGDEVRSEADADAPAAETAALENKLRMKLPEYLENEQAIAAWLASLDQARAEVIQLHVYWAIDFAQSLNPRDVAATQAAATRAVEFAAKSYDYRRGYDFRTYAQHWIEEYVGRASGEEAAQP